MSLAQCACRCVHVRSKSARKSEEMQLADVVRREPSFGFIWEKRQGIVRNGNLPARQEVQFVTRECVMILLQPDFADRRDFGKYGISLSHICFICPKDGTSPNSHPLLCCLLHRVLAALACLPTSASSFSDALFFDARPNLNWYFVMILVTMMSDVLR